MSLRVQSFVLRGIDAVSCEIEADVEAATTAKTTVVGLPDAAVRESVERVRAAIVNAGYPYPSSARVVINLAPAHVRKEGPVYDLPIAIAILGREQVIDHGGPGRERIASALFAGELALDGRIRPVRGVISMALLARRLGRTIVVVPEANVREAAIVGGVDAIGVSHLGEVWSPGSTADTISDRIRRSTPTGCFRRRAPASTSATFVDRRAPSGRSPSPRRAPTTF